MAITKKKFRRKKPAILITGIYGFVGRYLARAALEAGYEVRGLDLQKREPAGYREMMKRLPIKPRVYRGAITDEQAVRAALETGTGSGVDIVIHTAALVKEHGSMAEFRRVNVGGTRLVAQAARGAGAGLFIHFSSVMVYGFNYPALVEESGPLNGENNPYCQTKIESETAVRKLARPGEFDTVILRPGDVYGPGSIPWVERPARMMRRGDFALPDNGDGIINLLHISNLNDALTRICFSFLASRPGHFQKVKAPRDRDNHEIEPADFSKLAGEVLNLTDGLEVSFREYFTRLADIFGARQPPGFPAWMLELVAGGAQLISGLVPGLSEFTAEGIRYINRPYPYSNSRARRLLNWVPRVGLEEGLETIRAWYQKHPLA